MVSPAYDAAVIKTWTLELRVEFDFNQKDGSSATIVSVISFQYEIACDVTSSTLTTPTPSALTGTYTINTPLPAATEITI